MLNKYLVVVLIAAHALIASSNAWAKNDNKSETNHFSYHREISRNNVCSIVLNEDSGVKIVYSSILGVTSFRTNSDLILIDGNGRIETVMGNAPSDAKKTGLLAMIASIKQACEN